MSLTPHSCRAPDWTTRVLYKCPCGDQPVVVHQGSGFWVYSTTSSSPTLKNSVPAPASRMRRAAKCACA